RQRYTVPRGQFALPIELEYFKADRVGPAAAFGGRPAVRLARLEDGEQSDLGPFRAGLQDENTAFEPIGAIKLHAATGRFLCEGTAVDELHRSAKSGRQQPFGTVSSLPRCQHASD